jgi:nitrite reductase (NADH) large subunit
MRKRKLAIVGNGMGTCRLLDELALRGAAQRYEITVLGEERGGAYNRILLGRVLEGEAPDAIVTKPVPWYERHDVGLVDGVTVTRLDARQKCLETNDGGRHSYDVAVLATGSQPLVPALEGMTVAGGELRPGVFVYRTIHDCLRLRERARPGDGAIVVGGGLLGLEAAKVLSDRGLHVTIVDVAPILMPAQLDALGGEMLCRQIERYGIFVRTGRTVEAVYGSGERVEGLVLDDGATLPTDMVILACGVRPRVDLARASGLPVNRGIVVNDTLATEVPGVYAFGECAEHDGKTYGLVAPAWEQAAVLADVLTGANPQARYRGSKLYTRLKVAGVDVASMGCKAGELEGDEVVQILEERRNSYRKLIVRGGRLVGAMLVGNTAASASLVQLFDRGDPLPEDPLELFLSSRASAAPKDRLVCNCHKVTESAIGEAIAAGATSVEAIGTATKAGTGCGSCKSELAQLLPRTAKPVLLPVLAAS